MIDEIEKGRQEQEQKRKLWNEQQKARLVGNSSGKANMGDAQTKSKAEAKTDQKQGNLDEREEKMPQGRSPRAIAARLRANQARESATKQKIAKSSKNQASAKAEEIQKITKGLKNTYRVINGSCAITLFGLVVTWLVMNAQLIFGNLLKATIIPKLSLFEIIIIFFIDFLIFIGLLLLLFLIYILLNPAVLIS